MYVYIKNVGTYKIICLLLHYIVNLNKRKYYELTRNKASIRIPTRNKNI